MKKVVILLILVLLVRLDVLAQVKQWSLRECCDYAISHSISIHQKTNTTRTAGIDLSTARNSRLPNANLSANESFNFGRAQTIDGTYSNRNTNNTSFSLSTNVPLFTGSQITNQIKLNQLNLDAALNDLEKARNDIRMQVAKAYVQILYDSEMADVAYRQITIDSLQVVRLQALFNNGKASQAQLSQQMATLAKSHLTATQAENSRKLSLLALSQLLELPTPEGFAIVFPNLDELDRLDNLAQLGSPELIYQEALSFKPEIQAEQLRLQGAERSIKIAQAPLYPTLNLNAGLQSNYFKTNGITADPFFTQIKNNFAQYFGVSMNYTLFNRLATRNNIRKARVNRENQRWLLMPSMPVARLQ